MMGKHDEEGQLSNPLTRDEERDALINESTHRIRELRDQIQSSEQFTRRWSWQVIQLRNSLDLLRGNFKQAQERWQEERRSFAEEQERWQAESDKNQTVMATRAEQTRQTIAVMEKQSEIIKAQGAKLELLQSQQPQPFWVVSQIGLRQFMVMGPDKTTWFQIQRVMYDERKEGDLRHDEQRLGLCQQVCELLNKAWKEGRQTYEPRE